MNFSHIVGRYSEKDQSVKSVEGQDKEGQPQVIHTTHNLRSRSRVRHDLSMMKKKFVQNNRLEIL